MNTNKNNFINKLQDDANKHQEYFSNKENQTGLFLVKSANDWIETAKLRPIPKMLFDELWYENELCILFADTNTGKSILAYQIAVSISKSKPINGFRLDVKKKKVLYFDFELSDKQFELRYSENYANHFKFPDDFYRAEIVSETDMPKQFSSYEAYLIHSLEEVIIKKQIRVLIVDNITYLSAATEKAKDALPLMKQLIALKKKYNLSMLVLAHTPKRDISKPISKNDLQGSKMLINFCDSSFTIGESNQDKSLRYIKQIKARNNGFLFDKDNVVVCNIVKYSNFLEFEYQGFGYETEHLKVVTDKEKQQLENDILDTFTNNPALSLRKIAENFGVNHMKVKRIIERRNL